MALTARTGYHVFFLPVPAPCGLGDCTESPDPSPLTLHRNSYWVCPGCTQRLNLRSQATYLANCDVIRGGGALPAWTVKAHQLFVKDGGHIIGGRSPSKIAYLGEGPTKSAAQDDAAVGGLA